GGYLVIGSSGESVHEAVRLHREGGSLAKSSKFLAALPSGHSTQVSALYYSDTMKTLGLQLARVSPELAQAFSPANSESKASVITLYGEESAIREASASQGMDVGMMMVMAAVAIPNVLRAKSSADESVARSLAKHGYRADNLRERIPGKRVRARFGVVGSGPERAGRFHAKACGSD